MFLKVIEAIKGLKHLPKIYKALHEDICFQFKLIKIYYYNLKTSLALSSYLNCRMDTISAYYKHMGYYHLEVLTHYGFFVYKSHRIDDLYPNITILDKNDCSFKNLQILLEQSMCKINYINIDLNKEQIDLSIKFNSVSLPFVLESLEGGLNAIDEFLANLKTQLDTYNSIIFGVTAIAKGLNHTKKFSKYLNYLNIKKVFFNKDLSVNEISDLFHKHFPHVTLYYEGSCLFFILQPKLEKIKLKPVLPKNDPLEMPFN